ncbi:MAG: hypothetical protein R3F56_13305 [Planctomycetota bacterium]
MIRILPLVLFPLCAVAQGPIAPRDPRAVLEADDFLVPLHTAPRGDDAGAYGVWAMGRSYKASFHDGFAFYPRPTADDPQVHPLRYRLRAVTAGGVTLLDTSAAAAAAAPTPTWTPRRFARCWPGVTETYDVSPQGVEQSFVLDAPPRSPGDLQIVGSFDTDLRAEPCAAAHTALVFRTARGQALVRYGEATAIDAHGRRVPVTTGFDGSRVTLTVDGAWLRDAAYPVVVDPLTTRVVLHRSMTFFDRYYEARVTHNPTTGQLLYVFAESFGTSDLDVLAYVADANFGSPTLVYSDVLGGISSESGNVTFVAGAGKYALATVRTHIPTVVSSVRVYLHASGNSTLNSGTVLDVTPPASDDYGFADIGGSAGNLALMVYEQRSGNATQDVLGRVVDAAAATLGSPIFLAGSAAGTTWRRERPTVSAQANGNGSWVTAWQEQDRTVTNDDYDLRAARVTQAGVVAGVATVGPDVSTPVHKVRPKLDGAAGRYLVAWQQQETTLSTGNGLLIAAQRFDWAENAAAPVLKQTRTLDAFLTGLLTLGDVAVDTRTTSHWAVVYLRGSSDAMIRRVGYTAATVESQTYTALPTTGGFAASFADPGICFDPTNRRFPFVHTYQELFLPSGNTAASIYAQHLTYPSTAQNVLYGTSCGGSIAAPEPPYAGHEFYALDLNRALPGTPAVLEIALTPAAIPLAFFGMPNCFQNVDPATLLVVFGGNTDGAGHMRVTLPVPDDPATFGDLYFMYAHFAPGANPRGLLSTQGLRAQFR